MVSNWTLVVYLKALLDLMVIMTGILFPNLGVT